MALSSSAAAASSSSSSSSQSQAPKILLAKPGLVTPTGPSKFGREDETAQHHHRSRLPSIASLNLLSDSWDFHIDRFLPFLTENTDFKVVGIIGLSSAGKSTIMNELYGFDPSSPGMLPPFTVQSEDNRAMAKHCTTGIEPRISAERLILLDTQPVFSPSVLAETMRPDGSSTVAVLSGENLSAELAHELMAIQVDLLKHGIPDPSSLTSSHVQSSNTDSEKENRDKAYEVGEYMATPVFVHSKLQDENCTPCNLGRLRKALAQYFNASTFIQEKPGNIAKEHLYSSIPANEPETTPLRLFVIPSKDKDDSPRAQYESHISALQKLRDQLLSMNGSSFCKTISERDWLKNSAKIWELVKSSAIIAEYGQMLQSSGLFRR